MSPQQPQSQPPTGTDVRRLGVEFLGGGLGGALQVLAGNPLDVVKLQLQTGQAQSMTQSFAAIWRHEGVRGFYKGATPPLVMNGFLNAVLFSANGKTKRFVASHLGKRPEQLAYTEKVVATWMAAPVYTFFLTPVELIKCKLQFQSNTVEQLYRGPLHAVTATIQQEGVMGMFRGFNVSLATRVIGWPFLFPVYSTCKQKLTNWMGTDINTSSSSMLLIGTVAGGVAGMAFWTANYPVDMLKTRYQTQRGPHQSLRQIVGQVYASGGVRAFYRGFSACVMRAFPANGAAFLGLELTLQLFGYSSF